MQRPVCIDLFCGAGGLSEGMFKAGFQVAAGFDRDAAMLEVYKGRFTRKGTRAVRANLSRANAADLLRAAGVRGVPDVVCGGPPCQGFSGHRRGKGPDARNRLVSAFLRLAIAMGPRAIVLENVSGLTQAPHRRILTRALRRLERAGYHVEHKILDASEYGLPQVRRRLFIVALRGPLRFRWPAPSAKKVTLRDAISDLPRVANGHSGAPRGYRRIPPSVYQRKLRGRTQRVYDHRAAMLSRVNVRRIEHLRPGDDWRNLPRSLLTAGMRRAQRNSHTTRFGRLRWMQQSGTVLTRFDDPKNGAYIHPVDNRTLSVREAARLQGFPDGFRFRGTYEQQQMAIGNAVPPPIAQLVGCQVRHALTTRQRT